MLVHIPYLVAKPMKSGRVHYYWQPSAALRRAGWTPTGLGTDRTEAEDGARALNREIEAWKQGGEAPLASIRAHVAPATLGAIIARYRAERLPLVGAGDAIAARRKLAAAAPRARPRPGEKRFAEKKRLALSTQYTYSAALDRIEAWGGDMLVAAITPRRVTNYRDGLVREASWHTAHQTLRVGSALFKWAIGEDLAASNPFNDFELAFPPPREQIWEWENAAALTAAAGANRDPDIAFAVELAEWTGQREGDLIAMTERQWRPVLGLDPETRAALAGGADGQVMGIFIRQAKTRRWVGIPVVGPLRARIEMRIADNRALAAETGGVAVTTLLRSDSTLQPWTPRNFIRRFAAARARAIADFAPPAGLDLEFTLDELQFRDFRRTAVVRLGELGLEPQLISAITGHKLDTVLKILETYMPRTTKMAARAIVARIGQAAERELAAKQQTDR